MTLHSTPLRIKSALRVAVISAALSLTVHAGAQDQPLVCEQACADFEDKSLILQAKYELWTYGVTKVLTAHPDGMVSHKAAKLASPVEPSHIARGTLIKAETPQSFLNALIQHSLVTTLP